jgi:type IV secretory pathway VirB10-like protein
MAPAPTRTPLIPTPTTRVSRKRLGLVVFLLVLLVGGAFVYKINERAMQLPGRQDREIPEATAEGQLPSAGSELRRASSYAGLSLVPATPEPAPAAPPPAETKETKMPEDNPLVGKGEAGTGMGGGTGTGRGTQGTHQGGAARQPQQPKAANKWLFAKPQSGQGVQKPPFEDEKAEQEQDKRGEGLFPKAVWATPEDPTHVLYRSQVINGILQHDVNSDQPGQIRILVTEDVPDKFLQGVVLIPQYTILLGQQDGKVNFGQSRLGMTMDSAELPNGTVIEFHQFKAGDETGATGVSGSVDNHYVRLGIGAVLSAVLSVGSRAVAGNTTGFNPTLEQQFAADVSRDVNRTGQKLVDRFADVPPTITIPHGTPVTVQLNHNVNLMHPPTLVRQ